ncbi:uncharacterized protein IL334_006112 [Kwoniella shivajii]|uniref:C2H2-type domain-containing protein n=1 Tax=Kwoniella shivajii TaxID=564305 RepID=A0ABZ1D509_9TREE|nr:hypothetical protein IL334_006112 [Kwoniella shivajii]
MILTPSPIFITSADDITIELTSPSTSTTPLLTPSNDHLAPTNSFFIPLTSSITMTSGGSNNSSPTEFAFEPPTSTNITPFKPEPVQTKSFSSTGGESSPYTPTTGPINNPNPYQFSGSFTYNNSTASSFSSASGSGTGGSFSSIDALPAISREFVRPSTSETRRPATAGGALQSRSPFAGYMPGNTAEESGQNQGGQVQGQRFQRINQRPTSSDGKMRLSTTLEEGGEAFFTNPFQNMSSNKELEAEDASPLITKQQTSSQPSTIDPHYIPANRRASEPQFNVPQSWQQPSPLSTPDNGSATAFNITSAPTHIPQGGFLQQQQQLQGNLSSYQRPTYQGRPQTSDGLPSYPHLTGNVSLPSAQSIARQIPGMAAAGFYPPTPASARPFDQQDPKSFMPFRDDRSNSLNSLPPPAPTTFPGDRAYSIDSGLARQGQPIRSSYIAKPGDMSQSELTFAQLGGPAPKKRPRRRFDEIERLYACRWNGCEKSYGTLNHLNAHVAMQKHGEKRLPSEFKEMRKAWRKKKREYTASNANAMHPNGAPGWPQRASLSSASGNESDWDRRESMMSTGSEFTHRSSTSYPVGYAPWATSTGIESRPSTSSSSISSVGGDVNVNKGYFAHAQQQGYSHIPPSLTQSHNQNSYVNAMNASRRLSAPQHLPLPMPMSSLTNQHMNGGLDGFRQIEGDHPTPTAQNPFPQSSRSTGYPFHQNFQTLTSPMSAPAQQQIPITGSNGGEGSFVAGGQFAFQR